MKQSNLQKIQNQIRDKFLKQGVKMVGPETIFFSKDTKIGKNVTIEPYVVFGPKVKIGSNVVIKSFSHLEECNIMNKVEIGPYARIRTYKYIIFNFCFIFVNPIIITSNCSGAYID